jgi:predicted ATPase/DNA-binding XRE family transcriptional regulator
MNVDSPLFRDLLRQHRLAMGVSQEELAERAGLSARGISDLERGTRTHPHPETVRLLADALGLDGAARATFMRAAPRTIGRSAPRSERGIVRLPAPLAPLIGRHQERKALEALMRDGTARLVTLTGPGGVGKTRLALAVAERLAEEFRDGGIFIDLAPLQNSALLVAHVATTFGLRETSGRALTDVVLDYLRDREMLLVLDNFEHLLPAAPVVAHLLAACPLVTAIVTSRAPLRVRGEREYPVSVLRLPTPEETRDLEMLATTEAVAFFLDRLRAIRPDFVLSPDNAATVIAICQRLDGLPLALELAAARTKVLPLPFLSARLEARLPLLTAGTRDAPVRQRTLRDAIAWSYGLLGPEERLLFHRLSVFAGGWTIEAAEAVTNREGELDVLEGLAALTNWNLVQMHDHSSEPRYGMLETIHEFALERLVASGEETHLRHSHAAYFLSLAERGKPHLYSGDQRAWLRRLETEHPNFRAVLAMLAASGNHETLLRLAADLGLFWWRCGHLAEGRAHLERALAGAIAPTPQRAEALLGIGRIVTSQGDRSAADTWLNQSEELASTLNVPALLWQAMFQRGVVAEFGGDGDRAASLYESALAVASELNDPQAAGVALYALSELAYARGDLETAERQSEEAVALLRTAGDEFVLSLVLANVGAVALARGDPSRATMVYLEALDLVLGIDIDLAAASVLVGFAALAVARGDYVAAARLLGAAESKLEASHQERAANHVLHAQTTQAVHAALGNEAFARAREAGHSLPSEDATNLPRTLGLLAVGIP